MIRRLCLAAALLMFVVSPLMAEDDAFVFRQAKWGMSLEEVLISEVDHGGGTSPGIYVEQSGRLCAAYDLNPTKNYDGPLCRMEYCFNFNRESKPNTSLSEIIIAIRTPVSDSLASYYSGYLGLDLSPCEGFNNCLNMTKQALIKKYGSPNYDDPAKVDTDWEKPGFLLFIWGVTPNVPETLKWDGPGTMPGEVVIVEYWQEKASPRNRP